MDNNYDGPTLRDLIVGVLIALLFVAGAVLVWRGIVG